MADRKSDLRLRIEDAATRGAIATLRALPYRWRVPLMGWIASRIVAPAAGWRRRVRANLAHARPDLPQAEADRLAHRVADNVGRMLIEVYSGAEFVARARTAPVGGPGAKTLAKARAEKRPVVLVSGHFGNYDVMRAGLSTPDSPIVGLYRPMSNPHFNAHYVRMLETIAAPVLPADRSGISRLLKHLKSGGAIGMLVDIYASRGADLTYFGQSAPTATSAAEWAVAHDALMVPMFARRTGDGLTFDIRIEEPIPHGPPAEMMQAFNDRLEAQVRADMAQWFWIHRRWKPQNRRR